ncbi:unnamed protein product [Vitrella brassicaformis CCMP3155]|uniref:ATP synthase mitochondrial F1 complex assembly factor 2 n=1 Tax=Vitrella brassicaformis (strain CCMP3155) TaxID=1169540 RepID=A0A0G4EA51_VITBC|nr:unnamed protein product [Vitrella brassicaformis CCMP3155]|mmetsp:Transcript_20947/g.51047  ORF Transcript_20947/g.51047 Transcript_20947/m.51047 type:complete len:276 (-) Transcript_20947:370-1197(-)|eukprot:CEL92349.1 unnamed protein product [Vitrella brassicaformis CCMP3155]
MERRCGRWLHTSANRKSVAAAGTSTGVSSWRLRRFYHKVDVRQAREQPAAHGGEWEVLLDGRVLKTPAKRPLRLPSESLALFLASEWQAQRDKITPQLMPMMTLASTTLDVVSSHRESTAQALLNYLHTDTVCFRDSDEDLVRRQEALLLPVQRAFEERYCPHTALDISHDIRPPTQPPEVFAAVSDAMRNMSAWDLTALQVVTMNLKSLILGMGVVEGWVSVPLAIAAARLEETFQQEQWGEVEGDHDVERSQLHMWVNAASLFSEAAAQAAPT